MLDYERLEVREEDPDTFYSLPDFNLMVDAEGNPDGWLEHEFFGGLDNTVSLLLRQLENLPRPKSHLRQVKNRGWHLNHVLSPKSTCALAMYIGAQAVRGPAWREAVRQHTAGAIRDFMGEKVARQLESATDPEELAHLRELQGLRYMVADISGNMVPHLSGHLAYRLGEVLYSDYMWTVLRFPKPVLFLGDDPVLVSCGARESEGSYSQVATSQGSLFSVYQDVKKTADDAVDVLRGNDFVAMPLDPTRALVLSNIRHMILPGRYDATLDQAQAFNLLMTRASRKWVGVPPGHAEYARRALLNAIPG